ncbi:MAG: vWA domain-containing protein [Minicystis sp.]
MRPRTGPPAPAPATWRRRPGRTPGGRCPDRSGARAADAPGTSDPNGLFCSFPSDLPSIVHLTLPASRTLGSPALARGLTLGGTLPDAARMRATDFLNYYPVKYDDAAAPDQISFVAGVAPGVLSNEIVLQVAVQPPKQFTRPKVALAVVVDTSLSMAGSSIKRARAAAKALADSLQTGDVFTVITAKRAAPAKPITIASGADQDEARALAEGLVLDGGGDLAGALEDAYDAVGKALTDAALAGGLGRVVIISDGAAQPTSIDLGLVAGNREERQISLIGVGVGEAATYRSDFIDIATSIGGGGSLYLDREDAAEPLLHQRFDELMATVATDIEVTVTLPQVLRFQSQSLPQAVQADSPTGLVTATLGPGRALVLRNTLQTCLGAIDALGDSVIGVTVRWKPAGATEPQTSADVGGTVADLLKRSPSQIAKAGAIAAYGEALANVRPTLFQQAIDMAGAAMKGDPTLQDDAALLEIQSLAQANLDIIAKTTP